MQIPLTLLAAAYGATAGLFLARPAYRLSVAPGETWRSACPHGHPLTGWVGLARCTNCTTPPAASTTNRPRRGWYGPSTTALALAASLVSAALAASTGAAPELAVWLLLAPALLALAAIDLAVHRLPDVVTLPTTVIAVLLLGASALLPSTTGSFTRALLGMLALGTGYFVLFLISPSSIGFGDVKLAPTLGLILGWYGWPAVLLGAFAGQLFGALFDIGRVAMGRVDRKSAISMGPFMAGGALAGILVSAVGR